MDWTQIKTQAVWAILLSGATAAVGWMLGTSQSAQMVEKIERIAERQQHIEKMIDGRRQFMGDSVSRVEFLCNRDPDCRARFQPMQIPE